MAFWDFVKDAGKSVLGSEAKAANAPAPASPPTEEQETQRKVAALKAELVALGLTAKDVHLTLRGGDTVIIQDKAADQETLEKLVLALGNIKGIARVELAGDATPAPDAPQPVFHTVKKGENLSQIAQQYLGKANRYPEIFEANKPMLSHPDKIYPGQMLRIPQA